MKIKLLLERISNRKTQTAEKVKFPSREGVWLPVRRQGWVSAGHERDYYRLCPALVQKLAQRSLKSGK
ncbi:MAG: hypothetical protein JST32_19585 [Bacteroidetes bacterium]|nr:hypothetical protein [Bacteroidota bacterium]